MAIATEGATEPPVEMVIALLVAVAGLAQLELDVITQVITLPFVNEVFV